MKPTHALLRALERCPGVCPGVLIRSITAAVLNRDESTGVQLVGRIRREEFLCLFQFRLPDGEARYAICCCVSGAVITILMPDHPIWLCRGRFLLGKDGLEEFPQENTEEIER